MLKKIIAPIIIIILLIIIMVVYTIAITFTKAMPLLLIIFIEALLIGGILLSISNLVERIREIKKR